MSIEIRDLRKSFPGHPGHPVLRDINLRIAAGELVALLGPSGSGKTTLLRILAGLEVPDSGTILYEDEDATRRSPRDRNVGFVFQHYALFRHLSVFENIAFPLRVRGVPRQRVRERVAELLELIQLTGLGTRMPAQLSGGQRQRVALARALAAQPRVLLLDEPFGALDARVRKELRGWLRRLHDEVHVTSVLVTHDQEDAFEVADRIVVVNQGRIEQVGTPQEIFDRPASSFVIDFLGSANIFQGQVAGGRAHLSGVQVAYPDYLDDEPLPATIYVRPHELDIGRERDSGAGLRATVARVSPAGAHARVDLIAEATGAPLQVLVPQERWLLLLLRSGERVYVSPRRIHVFLNRSAA